MLAGALQQGVQIGGDCDAVLGAAADSLQPRPARS
jgi:hypothetical protein